MKKISGEDWALIHNRRDKLRAINALRRCSGLGLVQEKEAVENIWAGLVKLEDSFEKASPCTHCNGTGFSQ